MQNLKIGLLAASDFVLKHYCLELRKYNAQIIWGVTLLKTFKTLKASGEKNIFFYNEMLLDSAPNIIKRIFTNVGVKLDADLTGQNAILIPNKKDVISPIKELYAFMKNYEKGEITLGLLNNQLISKEKVEVKQRVENIKNATSNNSKDLFDELFGDKK